MIDIPKFPIEYVTSLAVSLRALSAFQPGVQ
jgi:hypothetical protein